MIDLQNLELDAKDHLGKTNDDFLMMLIHPNEILNLIQRINDYETELKKIRREPPGCDSAWYAKSVLEKYGV